MKKIEEEEAEAEDEEEENEGIIDDDPEIVEEGVYVESDVPEVDHLEIQTTKKAKRPPSKWIVYLIEQRKVVAESQPHLSFADQTKFIAQQYKIF